MNQDGSLVQGHKKFGNEWEEIVKWAHLDRTPAQIKDRFKRITKKQEECKKRKAPEEFGNGTPSKQQKTELKEAMAQLERERKALQVHTLLIPLTVLKEKEELIRQKEASLKEREEYLKQCEEKLKQAASKEVSLLLLLVTLQEKQENDKAEMAKKVLIQILQEKAEADKYLARLKIAQQNTRLGQVLFER